MKKELKGIGFDIISGILTAMINFAAALVYTHYFYSTSTVFRFIFDYGLILVMSVAAGFIIGKGSKGKIIVNCIAVFAVAYFVCRFMGAFMLAYSLRDF